MDINGNSLVSSIQQLEQQQNLLKQNIAWLKRHLDNLTEKFNTRPEPEQIAQLKDG